MLPHSHHSRCMQHQDHSQLRHTIPSIPSVLSQRMTSTRIAAGRADPASDADFRIVLLSSRYCSRKYTRPRPRAQSSSSSDEADDLPFASPSSTSSSAPRRPLTAARRELQTRVRRLQRAQTAAPASASSHRSGMSAQPPPRTVTASRQRPGDNASLSTNRKAMSFAASAPPAAAAAALPAAALRPAVETPALRRIYSQQPARHDDTAAASSASSASTGGSARQQRLRLEQDGVSPSPPSSSQAPPPLLSCDPPSSPSTAVFSASSDDDSSESSSQPSAAVLSQVKALLSGGQWRRRRQRRAQERWQRSVESSVQRLTERQERQAELVEMKRRSDEVQASSRIQRLEDRVLRGLEQLSRGQKTLRREVLGSKGEKQRKRLKSRHDTPPSSGSGGSAPSSQTLSAAAKPLQPPSAGGVIHTEKQLLWALTHFDAA